MLLIYILFIFFSFFGGGEGRENIENLFEKNESFFFSQKSSEIYLKKNYIGTPKNEISISIRRYNTRASKKYKSSKTCKNQPARVLLRV